jgi:hypothetical protein
MQLDREFAGNTSPGVKVALGDTNDDGNSAVDGPGDQIAQALPSHSTLPNLLRTRSCGACSRLPSTGAVASASAASSRRHPRAGTAVLVQRGAMACGKILQNHVASPVVTREGLMLQNADQRQSRARHR